MIENSILILALIVLVLVAIIFSVDFFLQFYTWQSRIHIGRYATQTDWSKKVLSKSVHWLKKTPTIKLTDNDRLVLVDILKGNYKRDAIQSWQEASLLLGLTAQYLKTKEENTRSQITNFLDSKIATTGNWKTIPTEIDGVILGYAILNIDWIDHQKYKPAYDSLLAIINNLQGEDSTIQYRNHVKDYRFVDTIGFICPFLMRYGMKFSNQKAIDLSIQQIVVFNQYALLGDTFIPCHTYHIHSKLPVGLFGWGRGLGWYAIGLIDAWNAMPSDDSRKPEMTNYVLLFAKMAMKFQNSNGSWSWIVTSKESRMDSSTTATLAWFLLQASKIDAIKVESELANKKALDYLMTVTRRDGAVDFSQGDTKAIGIHSQHFDILPFTQGFVLRNLFN